MLSAVLRALASVSRCTALGFAPFLSSTSTSSMFPATEAIHRSSSTPLSPRPCILAAPEPSDFSSPTALLFLWCSSSGFRPCSTAAYGA